MKTTKKHFDLFKREARKWIALFGLKGFEFTFVHNDEYPGLRGWCAWNGLSDRQFTIGLTQDWTGNTSGVSNLEVRETAFHEVCEGLLSRLRTLATERFLASEVQVDDEIHCIIRTLENTIFLPTLKKKP